MWKSVGGAWILGGTCVAFARNVVLFCLNANTNAHAPDINVMLSVLYNEAQSGLAQ